MTDLKMEIKETPDGLVLTSWYDGTPNDEYRPATSEYDLKAKVTQVLNEWLESEGKGTVCNHQCGSTPSYSYVTCNGCGSILTDGGWGIASRKWFDSVATAKFYQKHGRRPE